MRRIWLIGTFFALVAATCALWNRRFEHWPESPVWELAHLRQGAVLPEGAQWLDGDGFSGLRLHRGPGQAPVALRLTLPGAAPVHALHLSFRMAADVLIPGDEDWEDGRFIVEWHPPAGGTWQNTPAGSIRLNQQGIEEGMVMRPEAGPAVPVLRFEHLGKAGSFVVADLRLMVVEERNLWRIGRWLLLAGWGAWTWSCMVVWSGGRRGRSFAAMLVWMAMATELILPGPWKILRPIQGDFVLAARTSTALAPPAAGTAGASASGTQVPVVATPPVVQAGPVAPTGELPIQGSLLLKVKYFISHARPLLHALMLAVPVMFFALLLGRKPAAFLGLTLAAGIELAQFGFGYGFGWDDVFDLLCDTAGIAAGLWLAARPVLRLRLRPAMVARPR